MAPAELDAAVHACVQELLTAGPEAVAAAKALIPNVWGRPIAEAMPITAAAIAARRVSPEGQEGLRAFLEKRTASWSEGVINTKDTKDRDLEYGNFLGVPGVLVLSRRPR